MSLAQKRLLVYSIYVDDSERNRALQLAAAVFIPAERFRDVERDFGYLIETELQQYPEITSHAQFEFHASDIWNHHGAWENFPNDRIDTIFRGAVSAINTIGRQCVTYGVIDISGYPPGKAGNIERHGDAFEACGHSISEWFKVYAPNDFGTLTVDQCATEIDDEIKRRFRKLRPKVISSPVTSGVLECIGDTVSFTDSRESIGVQLADVCGWLIGRQLNGTARPRDTAIYQPLERFIHKPKHSLNTYSKALVR